MGSRRRSGDNLMTRKLRFRRMLCLLRHHGLTDAAREVGMATRIFFDADHMEYLLNMGHWGEADNYLQSFLPEDRSAQSLALIIHLRTAWSLATIANGGPDAAEHASTFDDQDLFQGPHPAKFRKLFHKMHADQPRAFMIWQKVAPDAVNDAMRLVARCPELKGLLELPRDRPMPWEVTPLIGARGSQKRRNGRAANRTPADILSRAFLQQKKLLSVQETNTYPEQQALENVERGVDKQDTTQL